MGWFGANSQFFWQRLQVGLVPRKRIKMGHLLHLSVNFCGDTVSETATARGAPVIVLLQSSSFFLLFPVEGSKAKVSCKHSN